MTDTISRRGIRRSSRDQRHESASMQPIAFILFGALLVGSVFSGPWALALILTAMPLKQALQGHIPLFLTSPTLANYCFGTATALSASRAFLIDRRAVTGTLGSFVWWGIMLLNVWCVVSCAWTPAPSTAIPFTEVGVQYAVLFLIFAPLLVSSLEDLGRAWLPLLVLGSVITVFILSSSAFAMNLGRISIRFGESAYSNSLALGELGGIMVIVAALLQCPVTTRLSQLTRLAGFLLGSVIALYSGSRGQILFSLAVVALFRPLVFGGDYRRLLRSSLVSILLLAVFVALAVILLPQEKSLERWDSDSLRGGFIVRLMNAGDLILAFLRTPYAWLIGLGFNAFAFYCEAVKEPYSHIVSLDVLCELGVPAFVLLCAIYLQTARAALRLIRATTPGTSDRSSSVILVAIALYEFLLGHKQGFFWSIGLMFFSFVLIVKFATLARTGASSMSGGAEPGGEPNPAEALSIG